jgi:hypothetical protein
VAICRLLREKSDFSYIDADMDRTIQGFGQLTELEELVEKLRALLVKLTDLLHGIECK